MVFTRRLGYQELIIDKRIDPKSQTLENPHGYNSNASSLWQAEKAERDCFVCNKSQMVTLFFRRQHLEEDFQLITNEVTR